MLNDTIRCTGLTRDASRICQRRRECERWLQYQRDLRSAQMVPFIVLNMPDGECMHRIAGQ